MAARTHTRSPRPASAGVEVRLPWWAVALPAVAFAALLLLISGSGEAHAATGDSEIGQLLERIVDLLAR
ncbi:MULTISPECIES: hypothetical protein [Streptomyces]|jgi:hypothetical protein|uniref:hypothetical protein n=1 Tax=unclassified Streptomyces TaxID=2593676 RepID=UPI0008866C15|nr:MULTISPECIES: hypothetical protein [unclassified Streptomyces]MDX2729154.1 hypothetical protein [Streptomyces sp. PA03-2a]MDX3768060.1 hypothetical protein [Streptomyces sp. AK08-01B]MDX3817674.1 hypothetical protein [Streptomyces sp. AK08-01A]SCY32821.1 hypothetical protein SAMN02745898_1011651 [Streptomyces sp. 136MFCol5.1]SFS80851.1 hypothetical protein SAMN04487982_103644 [Streptomyces sp. ok210]